ncbi:MAG: amino acid permease C-terminal domain-containing protein [Verrucomicrobiota bacterium]
MIVLRRVGSGSAATFRHRFILWVPLGAIVSCLWLMSELLLRTWIRFIGWLLVGLVFYALYGYRHSRLAPKPQSEPAEKV